MSSEVRVYNLDGRLVRIVRSHDLPIPITDAEAEAQMRSTIPRNVSDAERQARMDRMRAMQRASTWPLYRGVLVDAGGRIWVQDYSTTRQNGDTWTAFDSTGRMIGKLSLPAPSEQRPRLEVLAFGLDDVLVRRYDADRATYLTIYPIVRVDDRR
jgi:hypothetical protein